MIQQNTRVGVLTEDAGKGAVFFGVDSLDGHDGCGVKVRIDFRTHSMGALYLTLSPTGPAG